MPDSTVRPALFIQLFHTGLLQDGRPNTSSVLVNDLDVGQENQNRKVPVYVPVGGSIIVPASSRSMLSFQEGTIRRFCQVGVLRARMFYQPERYTTAGRPSASEYPVGVVIWDTTDGAPYWSDGVNWVGVATAMGPAGGDLDGTYPNPTVVGLEGYPIEVPPPANGDVLLFDGALQKWVHAPIVFGGGPPVGPAGGDLFGTYPNPTVTGLQTDALPAKAANGFLKRDAANTAWEEVPYGSAANTVCVGNDARLSNARTPLAHKASHTTGGTDAITVSATTATNSSSTTGVSVNSAAAAVSVADPGHTHTLGAATATNNSITMTGWYALNTIESDGVSKGTIAQNASAASPTGQPGVPRTMHVVFPAGWAGGTITVNGTGRGGAAISEVFTKPGGGGTVVGVKPFFTLTSFVNSSVVGPGSVATVATDFGLGVPEENVLAFLKVSIDGLSDTFNIADVANGVFDAVGAHQGNHGVDVWYTYSLNLTQASHTHTAGSATTGVTASDSGHTHGTTDPGHGHTQAGHSHALS